MYALLAVEFINEAKSKTANSILMENGSVNNTWDSAEIALFPLFLCRAVVQIQVKSKILNLEIELNYGRFDVLT